MIKREFRAKIVDNFREEWLRKVAFVEDLSYELVCRHYTGTELDALHDRISGKVVTIQHSSCLQGEDDFFEKEDDDFVIHPSLFTEIQEN